MAMTIGRWMAIAVAACTIVAAALLRPVKHAADGVGNWWLPVTGDEIWRASTKNELRVANERLRTIELRDSVVRTLSNARYDNALAILVDSRFSDSVRRDLELLAREQWKRVSAKAGTRTAIVFVLDTQKVQHGYPRLAIGGTIAVDVTAAAAIDGGACLSIVRLGMQPESLPAKVRARWREGLHARAGTATLLGPCAFAAAFGVPGDGVAAWLASTNWLGARRADWTSHSAPIDKSDLARQGFPATLWGMTERWRLRELLSPSAMGCVGGRMSECRTVLDERRKDEARDDRWANSGIASSRFYPLNPWFTSGFGGLGPSESWVLSDMRSEIGAERFEQFWTSRAPVDSAFRASTGEPLDAWLRRWMQRTYGEDTLGPAMPSRSAAVGGGLLVAALGLAALVAGRRRVG